MPVGGIVHAGSGLRARIWVACLAGSVLGAIAVLGLFAWLRPADPLFDPWSLGVWPWTAALLCLALGVVLGFWLDHGIATHVRELSRALAAGDPSALGSLPAATRWGELSLLTAQIQSLLVHTRENGHTGLELEELKQRIRALRTALETRPAGAPEPLRPPGGLLGPLVETINRRLAEGDRSTDEGREDLGALLAGAGATLAEARDSAGQAERGFVETTALIGTVRELQRLGGELQQQLAGGAGADDGPTLLEAQRRYREAAAGAIEEMVASSNESLERLAAGLMAVQEIGEHVQVLANRATLVALNATLAGGSPESPDDPSRDLRGLAAEVRRVTDLTAERFAAVDREVAAAVERMKGLRDRVASRLDEAPPLPESVAATGEQALRLAERLRDMVQDAATRGERLAATGESASRAAERLVRRLEEDAATLDRLARRLGLEPPPDRAAPAGPADVRLLGPEDAGPAPGGPA